MSTPGSVIVGLADLAEPCCARSASTGLFDLIDLTEVAVNRLPLIGRQRLSRQPRLSADTREVAMRTWRDQMRVQERLDQILRVAPPAAQIAFAGRPVVSTSESLRPASRPQARSRSPRALPEPQHRSHRS
jgi:hypothetical protein